MNNQISTGRSRTRIASAATAVPAGRVHQQQMFPLIKLHYGSMLKERSLSVLEQVLAHPSIRYRHIAVDSLAAIDVLKTETLDQRMERFTKWSVDLSCTALENALAKTAYSKGDISALVVNTCTGYICPGISTYIHERLGLSPSAEVFDLVGAGCGGALPAIQMGRALLETRREGIVACVSVEICSATYEMEDDMALLISNAIFGDGAAAVILTTDNTGPAITATGSRLLPEFREDVRYVYRNGRLHNRLSPALPKITGEAAALFVNDFLASQGMGIQDIDRWAIHPGGDKVLNEVQRHSKLTDANLSVSREVLLNYGNMSSPTVLFELERILQLPMNPGQKCLMLAFGAGLSLYGMLLEQ